MLNFSEVSVFGFDRAIKTMRFSEPEYIEPDSDCILLDNVELAFQRLALSGDYIVDNNNNGQISYFRLGADDRDFAVNMLKSGYNNVIFLDQILVQCVMAGTNAWFGYLDSCTYPFDYVCTSCLINPISKNTTLDLDDFDIDNYSAEEIKSLKKSIDEFNLAVENDCDLDYLEKIVPKNHLKEYAVTISYASLACIYYHMKKSCTLDNEKQFCEWVESLPYSELITGEEIERYIINATKLTPQNSSC